MKLLNLGCGNRFHSAWINVDLYSTGPEVISCDLRHGLPFKDSFFDVVYHSHLLEHLSKTSAVMLLQECFRVLREGGIIRVVVPNLEEIVKIYLKILEEVEEGNEKIQAHYNWIIIELLDQMVRNQSGGEMLKYWKQNPMPAADFVFKRVGSELLSHLSNSHNTDRSIFPCDSDMNLNKETKLEASEVGKFRISGEVHQWMYDRYSLRVLLQEIGFKEVQLLRANQSSIPDFNTYLLDIEEDGSAFKPVSLYMEGRKLCEDQKQLPEEKSIETFELRTDKVKSFQLPELLPKGTQSLLNKIRKLNSQLAELRKDRDAAVDAIHKRDQQLADLQQDRNNAVEEIHKRDAQLAELRKSRNSAVEEVHKRDAQLAELHQDIAKLSCCHDNALNTLPLVSIVTPVLNCAKWIEHCVKSVMMQNYPKIKHIIVDGGSTDGTLEICKRYPHLIIHSKKDRGQSHAINKGFAIAQGEILAWLCADDEYEPGAVQTAVKKIMSGDDIVMGFSRFIDAVGNLIADHPADLHPYYDHDMFLRFWRYNPVSQPATFWTRKMWEMCGPLRENLEFAMDYDLWVRMSRIRRFERIQTYLAKYRLHPDAKCLSDNYRSRVELIRVSRQYWPSKWKPSFWKLYLGYIFTKNPITQHYTDGEVWLEKTNKSLDSSKRWLALFLFIKTHYKHFAAPYLPDYKPTLKRVLCEIVGPPWFWRLGKKIWLFFRRKDK